MDHANACFAASYEEARSKFQRAAADAGLPVASIPYPLPGVGGEALALDVVQDGALQSNRVLLVSSACHGVEGYCGSGVQVAVLGDAALRQQARAAGVRLLYLHALNPHGFSFGRRVTHENVDLNRNFPDFAQPLPDNPGYRELHAVLLPAQWPPGPENQAALTQFIERHGIAAFQQAVSGGQYQFADGLFYGGQAPTHSHHSLRQALRQYLASASHVGWVDLHTGLGPTGVGERIIAVDGDAAALARARHWWNPDGSTPITSSDDGSSTSAPLTGLIWRALAEQCPAAQCTGIVLEFGTVPLMQVLQALRADHWLHQHPEADLALAAQIRQQIKDAFYCDNDQWRGQILAQGKQVLEQGVAGLAGLTPCPA